MYFLRNRKRYPDASRSVVGFQAQMKTSDSCPRSTVALLAGISMFTSTSISVLFCGGGATAVIETIIHITGQH